MRQNSRGDILKCALTLFSQKGYEGTSPNEIAEAAGITKPTLYYFFGDKEGLLDTLLSEYYTRLHETLNEICIYIPDPDHYEHDIHPLLSRIAKAVFAFAEANHEFYLFNISLSFAPPASKAAKVAENYSLEQYRILKRLFTDISGVHKNLSGKEEVLAFRFLALLNAQVILWFRKRGSLSANAANSIVTGFMHGIFSG